MLHPTEKPVGLLELFIKNSSDKDNIIFDGFIGSASTVITCLNTGRQYIGFELDNKYYNIANERVNQLINKSVI